MAAWNSAVAGVLPSVHTKRPTVAIRPPVRFWSAACSVFDDAATSVKSGLYPCRAQEAAIRMTVAASITIVRISAPALRAFRHSAVKSGWASDERALYTDCRPWLLISPSRVQIRSASPQVVASVHVIEAHFVLPLALATAATDEATAFQ